MDADTQALVDRRSGELVQWHIYWTTPALIVALFMAGFAAAVGHHLFYMHLNGKPATEQLKMVRYGTALAFFVKSTLVGTVIMCNRQRIWYTFRRKAMTINGIDGLFSATEDPTQFFLNWEMIRNGKLATLMAACTWESTYNFRDMSKFWQKSLNFYNTTEPIEEERRDGEFYPAATGTGSFFDYYDQPSKNARRLAFSAFENEPNLWIGYAINTSKPYSHDAEPEYKAKWGNLHEPKIFKCVMQYTRYTFNMSYNPRQSATRLEREFLRPVIGDHPIEPQKNTEEYKVTASFHTLGSLLRRFLRGKIEKQKILITYSDLSETRLVNSSTSYPLVDLKTEIQDLFEDILITLLNDPNLAVVQTQEVPCTKSRTMVVYVYYKHSLWIGYAIVIAITFAFILVGAWSLHMNGVASDVLFSRIMATTRNPTLDHLSVGACLGGDPFPKELAKTKLRFGVLLEDDPREGPLGKVEHCCFGTMGETKEIVKGGTYAGLKEYRADA
ncbi:uncharacterized protein J4E92_000029 [Alternaria infectoria]|uniref:uncharacterized protein n=1 Tax=Alternaria infectoria TaxID=45303 RepID=UPI00221E3F21|nr:uncharacterized protein J4E92_000029 [Alternaria infectoria]KAI4938748.1 hypothetical protein J4E92_000029 [Alternaria infectoria]